MHLPPCGRTKQLGRQLAGMHFDAGVRSASMWSFRALWLCGRTDVRWAVVRESRLRLQLQLMPNDGALAKLAADYQHMVDDGLFLDDVDTFAEHAGRVLARHAQILDGTLSMQPYESVFARRDGTRLDVFMHEAPLLDGTGGKPDGWRRFSM